MSIHSVVDSCLRDYDVTGVYNSCSRVMTQHADRVRKPFNIHGWGRVWSDQVRRCSKFRGSGRVVGSGRVGSFFLTLHDPTRPDPRCLTRPVKSADMLQHHGIDSRSFQRSKHLKELEVQRHAYAHVLQLVQTRIPDAALAGAVDRLRTVVFGLGARPRTHPPIAVGSNASTQTHTRDQEKCRERIYD